jgi:hypothetical protein
LLGGSATTVGKDSQVEVAPVRSGEVELELIGVGRGIAGAHDQNVVADINAEDRANKGR